MVSAEPANKRLYKSRQKPEGIQIIDKNSSVVHTIREVHLSPLSDAYEPNKEYAYFMVYTLGSFDSQAATGLDIKPGFFMMVKVETLEESAKNGAIKEFVDSHGHLPAGQIHGKAWHYFHDPQMKARGLEPILIQDMIQKKGAAFGGGSLDYDGEIKLRSRQMNTSFDDAQKPRAEQGDMR